ncbi:Spc98 family-domain-containing protein [Lentinula raphanica]|nr:Spc98 family-domain-containing protein [Lentinula raphanica]
MTSTGSISSLLRRPQSSASQYLASDFKHHESTATVSALARPSSSISLRPTSRASYRPKSRQHKLTAAKLLPLCEDVVRKILGQPGEVDEEHEKKYHEMVDWSVKQLGMESTNKAALVLHMEAVDKMVHGHVEKGRVKSQDMLADALERCFGQLKEVAEGEHDLDDEIKKSRLPAHMQYQLTTCLQLALSSPPQSSTLTHASIYLHSLDNPPSTTEDDRLTWKKILEEDPYEGDHWIGVPADDSESLDDLDTSPSLSPLRSDDLALDDTDSEKETFKDSDNTPDINPPAGVTVDVSHKPLYTTYAYRKELEDLRSKQYWQSDWRMSSAITLQKRGTFDIGDASTLGLILRHFSCRPCSILCSMNSQRHIREQDAVREVFIALQGRENVLYDQDFKTTTSTPKLLHFSLASQQSLLDHIGDSCRTIQSLRRFTSSIMHHSSVAHSSPKQTISAMDRMRIGRAAKITRTLEAFADAIDTEIRSLEVWCSIREEAWLRALNGLTPNPTTHFESELDDQGLIVSLLGTEKALRDQFEDSFNAMLKIVIQVVGEPQDDEWTLPTQTPSSITTLLLDTLFSAVQLRLERGNQVTAATLTRVFVRSAEPIWRMVGRWISHGFEMNSGHSQTLSEVGKGGLDEEFFIEWNGIGIELGVIGLLDPDFWQEGYCLRGDTSSSSVSISDTNQSPTSTQTQGRIPNFLKHVAVTVLESGKAMGLLSALGADVQVLESAEAHFIRDYEWPSFQKLVADEPSGPSEDSQFDSNALFAVSVDQLSRRIYDKLAPYCHATGSLLAKVIIEECDFWIHLRAIESVFLMQRGDIISDFADILFAKMDSKQNWTDFHFLNTAFTEIIAASNNVSSVEEFIEISLFRLSYKVAGFKEKNALRTVKAFDGLSLEYLIPFPLTYTFTPRNMQIYAEIFVFLLQIRRAKDLLEKILVRGASSRNAGLKAFYAMRSRLNWFVNTFLNFLTTYVIQTQALSLHKTLAEAQAQSFDQVIKIHEDHLQKLHSRCLLQTKTNALYQAILSVLDMTMTFNEIFGAFAGDMTLHDISGHSIMLKHHRSRRQRRRRKNVIGFSHSMNLSYETSESERERDEDEADYSYSVSINASTFAEGDNLSTKLHKMSTDLDGLVRFIRRGIETLAGGTSDASTTFGILAFALQDWDL